MTQIELAEKLNYSDKAISKWERGESVPDIAVLKAIADLFGVSVDYLISRERDTADVPVGDVGRIQKRKRGMITGMSLMLVWVVAIILFIVLDLVGIVGWHWLCFIYAPVCDAALWLVLNSVWFNKRFNFVIVSVLLWLCLAACQLTAVAFGVNIWQVYLLGLPGQVIIALWSRIGKGVRTSWKK